MTEDIDRWSAEVLMGWSPNDNNWCWLDAEGKGTGYTVDFDGYTDESWHPSDPTTGQIWMVVKKMREKGWYLALFQYSEYEAFFSRSMPNPDGNSYFASDPNPAQAILLAAKSALESVT